MKSKLTAIALICFATAMSAQAMTKDEHKAANARIEADYKTAKKSCDAMKDNAKDICEKEAKGQEKIAKAELEQNYKPSDKNAKKVEEVKADVAYDVAKEKCEDQKGAAEKSCKDSAKSTHEMAMKTVKAKKA